MTGMSQLRLALFFGVLLVPGAAFAHPDVDEGRRLAQSAELERALEAFDRAEASGELGREDRIALLEGRALVYHALGDTAALDRTLAALVELAPSHRMGRDIPPDLGARFEALRPEPEASAPSEAPSTSAPPPEREPQPEPVPSAEPVLAPTPAETARAAAPVGPPPGARPLDDTASDGVGPWPFVAAAAVVVAVGAAVAVYLLVPGSTTEPSFPRHPL